MVSPGIGADRQTTFDFRELMIDDFPTFGYPTNPTLIVFFSWWKLSNCLNSEISCPFPNGLLTLARKASVGCSFCRYFTHLY